MRNLTTRLYFKNNSVVLRLARHLCSSTPLVYWRASVASETLTGVKMKKSGMFVYLYICMDVCMSFCTLTLAFLC